MKFLQEALQLLASQPACPWPQLTCFLRSPQRPSSTGTDQGGSKMKKDPDLCCSVIVSGFMHSSGSAWIGIIWRIEIIVKESTNKSSFFLFAVVLCGTRIRICSIICRIAEPRPGYGSRTFRNASTGYGSSNFCNADPGFNFFCTGGFLKLNLL